MATPEENKDIVRRVTEEGVNTGDLGVFREVLAEDYARHSQATTGLPEIRGVEPMLSFLESHFAAFPDWCEEIELILADGDKVAYITNGTGTQTGPMGDLPPTGRKVQVVTYVVHRLRDGQIAETWVGWDNMAILSQLGLLRSPAAGGA